MVEFTRSLGASADVGYQIMEELDNPSKLPYFDRYGYSLQSPIKKVGNRLDSISFHLFGS